MCGDTGCRAGMSRSATRRARGRPGRPRSGLAARHREGDAFGAASSQPRASAVAHRSQQQFGIGAPEIEYAFHPDADWVELTTVHKGGLFGSDYRMLFPADGIEGIKRFYLDTLIGSANAGSPASPPSSASGSAAPRTPAWCSASRRRACASSAPQSRSAHRRARRGIQGAGQQYRHGRHGLRRLLDGDRLPYRGRILPHRRHADVRAHVLPVVAPRLRPHCRRRQSAVPHRSDVVHRLYAPLEASNGEQLAAEAAE